MSNLQDINSRMCDRSNCFYWQADRKISVEEAAFVWVDRHSGINDEDLIAIVNEELEDNKLIRILPLTENSQELLGNVNSVRVGELANGRTVIIRCHPKGLKNGYFHVESLAAKKAIDAGLPSYETLLIYDLSSKNNISFQVIEKLDGINIKKYLEKKPNDDSKMAYEMGRMMAKVHKIKVDGYGPFDNELAKKGILKGIHYSLSLAVNAALDDNLDTLVSYDVFSREIADKIKNLFLNNDLLISNEAVLLHNDFVDWNLLTDEEQVSGIFDWDECVGGDPIEELACWSTFFVPERLTPFLEGYFSDSKRPDNFDDKFQLLRLRYTVSKMTLRLNRYNYEKTDFMKMVIDRGNQHLKEMIEYFNL